MMFGWTIAYFIQLRILEHILHCICLKYCYILDFMQEFHKEGSIVLKSRMPSWGPRKLKSNGHFYAIFRAIEEEVKETKDEIIEQLFVEVFKDKESIVESLVENLKKVEEVEDEMTGGLKRTYSEIDDEPTREQPEDLDAKIDELLTKFELQELVHVTKFFKVISRNGQPHLAVAHPRIQKKAGHLSYPINFKGHALKTDCAALTNLDSDVMSGRGNTGPAFCTLVPVKDLGDETKSRVFSRFNMEILDEIDEPSAGPSASQDFPFLQSQTEETIKVCQVCRYTTRDKIELKEHMKIHYQCETCLKYFATKDELEHHLPEHEKEMCSECKNVIRKDEMMVHKMNHMKLKTFGKKLLKQKTVKPATGYGLWQSEERKRIMESNPAMNFNDVSSELGRRWRLISKECKDIWKTKAVDWNERLKTSKNALEVATAVVEELDDVEDEPEVIEIENLVIDEVEVPARSTNTIVLERSNDCPLCEFTSTNSKAIKSHMNEKHKMSQGLILLCEVCKLTFIKKSSLEEHMQKEHEVSATNANPSEPGEDIAAEIQDVDDSEDMEIVLVKSKKLSWPAIVLSREDNMVEVKMIHDDKVKVVVNSDVDEFDITKIGNSKNSRLKQAFAKAATLIKK